MGTRLHTTGTGLCVAAGSLWLLVTDDAGSRLTSGSTWVISLFQCCGAFCSVRCTPGMGHHATGMVPVEGSLRAAPEQIAASSNCPSFQPPCTPRPSPSFSFSAFWSKLLLLLWAAWTKLRALAAQRTEDRAPCSQFWCPRPQWQLAAWRSIRKKACSACTSPGWDTHSGSVGDWECAVWLHRGAVRSWSMLRTDGNFLQFSGKLASVHGTCVNRGCSVACSLARSGGFLFAGIADLSPLHQTDSLPNKSPCSEAG